MPYYFKSKSRTRLFFSPSGSFHGIVNNKKSGEEMDKRTIIPDNNPTLSIHRTSVRSCNHLYVPCILLLLALIFVVGCEREIIVPQTLTGEWNTSAPGYADRYMKFTKDTLIYGIGNGKEMTHNIIKIDSEQFDHLTAYTFYYRDAEGDKAILSFTYRPDAGGSIQMKNNKILWKKAAP